MDKENASVHPNIAAAAFTTTPASGLVKKPLSAPALQPKTAAAAAAAAATNATSNAFPAAVSAASAPPSASNNTGVVTGANDTDLDAIHKYVIVDFGSCMHLMPFQLQLRFI